MKQKKKKALANYFNSQSKKCDILSLNMAISIFLGYPKNAKKHDFGYPKNRTSGAQNKNLTPDLESVTKTDSKTGFRFEF